MARRRVGKGRGGSFPMKQLRHSRKRKGLKNAKIISSMRK